MVLRKRRKVKHRSWDYSIKMKIFKDRQSAGKLLANRLKNTQADLVLGIPRGGVLVAKEIADRLGLPLDIIVTRKIGVPTQPELALGALDSDGEVVWDNELLEQLEFKILNFKFKIEEEWKEVKRREDLYRDGRPPLNVEGKIVVLVDDGIATGATVLSAINFLKRHGMKRVILAVPVVSQDTLDKIVRDIGGIGEVISLHSPENFQAVGQFYKEFNSVSDEQVVRTLSLAV